MASTMRKRKAVDLAAIPEKKRVKVESSALSPEFQVDDDDDESELSYQGSEEFSDDDEFQSADTPITPLSPRKKFPSQLKTLKCTLPGCTKTFNRPARLATHIRSHNNERTFICTYESCDKSYCDQKHLTQHIKAAHTNERPYKCNWEGCTKSFLTGTRLRRHIETHEGKDRFKCTAYPPCNKTFRKHQTLQRHIRSDHLELAPYPCTYIDPITSEPCNAGFDGAAGLRKHEDRIHGLQRFFCPDCTLPGINPDGSAIHLGFTTDTQLQNHIKKEHANCPFCDRKCSSQRELQKHVESQHSGTTLDQRKIVPCTYEGCKKTFTKKYNRDVHIRTQHEGSRFICGTFDVSKTLDLAGFDDEDACGKDFASKANLQDHIRTAHLGLPSLINANRKKPCSNYTSDDGDSDLDLVPKSKKATKKSKEGKKAKSSAIDDLLGLSYASDPRRNIPCLITTCPHLFIRDYDLQHHIRTKHRLATPEIDKLEKEDAEEPEFQFKPGDSRNNDAYGGEDGESDLDVDWESGLRNLDLPFWLGGEDDGEAADGQEWTRDELEMRRLIGEE